ncbi:hypothetical protein GCM10025868_02620 [Angustibacter aerolatus]|uniref:Uncharacterized protein n=1 Tax=Angustibacter aerolatus TaxID=1162965 RepID=A0ABQ6JB48_9ACTN|nr:hypothetical protein GCM10025868_02620 [Angustibacter aerolatus]
MSDATATGAPSRREPLGDRRQGVPGLGRALGPPEVRADDDPGTRLAQALDRRHGRADAPVVGDRRAVERDVQVAADQHAPPAQVTQVVDRAHYRLAPTFTTRSTRRFE